MRPDIDIQVDGGIINNKSLLWWSKYFVAGSYVFSGNYQEKNKKT